MINISKKNSKLGFSVRPIFQIAVHDSDKFILCKIKKFFNNVGSIKKIGLYYYYKIESFKNMLEVIIPHFDKYPLLSINKSRSYYLFKECIHLRCKYKKMDIHLLNEFIKYKACFKQGYNARIFKYYNEVIPFDINSIPKPKYEKINPYWIAGFTSGDGTFGVYQRGGKYKNYNCSFRISQDKIDKSLLKHISKYLGCGKIISSKLGMINLGIYSFKDLSTIIVPFFKKYKLKTSKEIDFYYFCEIIDIFNKKGHKKRWKQEDIEKIKILTSKMNNYRRKYI